MGWIEIFGLAVWYGSFAALGGSFRPRRDGVHPALIGVGLMLGFYLMFIRVIEVPQMYYWPHWNSESAGIGMFPLYAILAIGGFSSSFGFSRSYVFARHGLAALSKHDAIKQRPSIGDLEYIELQHGIEAEDYRMRRLAQFSEAVNPTDGDVGRKGSPKK